MSILTDRGWMPLKPMLTADLRQASRELPGASRAEVVRRADEIYEQTMSRGTP